MTLLADGEAGDASGMAPALNEYNAPSATPAKTSILDMNSISLVLMQFDRVPKRRRTAGANRQANLRLDWRATLGEVV